MAIVPGALSEIGAPSVASPVPCTYVFSWAGAASSATPATLASYATAWAISATVGVGAVRLTSDGYAIGCVIAGTTAAAGTGPTAAAFASVVTHTKLACEAVIPAVVDGTAEWMLLSGSRNIINVVVFNRHASAVLDYGSLATVASGSGSPIPPGYGTANIDGITPETIYIVSDTNTSAFSVTVFA